MTRIPLYHHPEFQYGEEEKTGRWFDSEKAVKLSEDTYWNGQNRISKVTSSEFHHETLYYTKSGYWVKNTWSNFQGSVDKYYQIDEDEAVDWLVNNETNDEELEQLPEKIQAKVKALIADREL